MNSPKPLPTLSEFDASDLPPFGVRSDEEFREWNRVDSRVLAEETVRQLNALVGTEEYKAFVSRVRKREFWAVDITRGIGSQLIGLERILLRVRIRINLMALHLRLKRMGKSLSEAHRPILSPGQVGDSFGDPLHMATVNQSDIDYYNSFFDSLL